MTILAHTRKLVQGNAAYVIVPATSHFMQMGVIMAEVAQMTFARVGATLVILGGTALLLLMQPGEKAVSLVDTIANHVAAAIELAPGGCERHWIVWVGGGTSDASAISAPAPQRRLPRSADHDSYIQ